MPEEPYPLLAGEHVQPIDMFCMSYTVIAIGYAPQIIYYRPIYVNSKVLLYIKFLPNMLNIIYDIYKYILYMLYTPY
jgi:hypothetical protein